MGSTEGSLPTTEAGMAQAATGTPLKCDWGGAEQCRVNTDQQQILNVVWARS